MAKNILFSSIFLSNFSFLFWLEATLLGIKCYILSAVVIPGWRKTSVRQPLLFLALLLIGAMAIDITWIFWLFRKLFYREMSYSIILFFIRLSWAFFMLQYQSLALFLDSLFDPNYQISLYQKVFIYISSAFACFFVYLAIFDINFNNYRMPIEFIIVKSSTFYCLGPMMIITLLFCFKNLFNNELPTILKKQVKIIIKFFIAPFLVADIIQTFPFSPKVASNTSFWTIGISSTLITFGMLYSAKKIMGLRFLNLQDHVQGTKRFNFINDFKNVLEQLSLVSNANELRQITQTFFNAAFNTSLNGVQMYMRKLNNLSVMNTNQYETTHHREIVENFIHNDHQETKELLQLMLEQKIWNYDEIEFTNFYGRKTINQEIIKFLAHLDADIFLPIYEHTTIIGYIIVERHARKNFFYNDIECDQMVVFASYLGHVINLLQNRSIHHLLHKEKLLQEELYTKMMELDQFKESIRTFLRDTNKAQIGILFYKSKRFSFANDTAQKIVKVNPNGHESHPMIHALKSLVQNVEQYKTSESKIITDLDNQKILITCTPDLEEQQLIITITHADVSEVLKKQLYAVNNPSEWDYVLYLETTKTGQLINQLIPGNGTQLLHFKVELLKVALTKKALLIDMPEQDLQPTIEILHHVSLRQRLHTINLSEPCKENDMAPKLFGLNPLYGHNQPGLLTQLDNYGTLFIKNVEFLDMYTQEVLADYIRYGYFVVYKSDQKVSSNVRIICSSKVKLQILVQEGKFSKSLFTELHATIISLPSLLTLPEEEIRELAKGYRTQEALITHQWQPMTQESAAKMQALAPASLTDFKLHVEQLLAQNPAPTSESPMAAQDDLEHDTKIGYAVDLGKRALKDKELMTHLWNKFKNQNKLATLLGVNRSSINRRCKEYNLH